jgi:hypothetical protein
MACVSNERGRTKPVSCDDYLRDHSAVRGYGTRSVMFETAYCKLSLKPTGTQHCSPRVSECESLTHRDSHTIPSPSGETQKQHRRGSRQRPCSGAVADREALRGTLGEAAPVEARMEPPRGTKGRKHSTHQHPCSGAVACRETLRGGLGGLSLRGVMGSGGH